MRRYVYESDCGCGCGGSGGCGDRQEESKKMGKKKKMVNVMFPEGVMEGDLVMDEEGNHYEVVSMGEGADHHSEMDDHEEGLEERRSRKRRKPKTYADYLKGLGKTRVSRSGGQAKRVRGAQRRKNKMTPAEFRAAQRKRRRTRVRDAQKSKQRRRRTGKARLKMRARQNKRLRGESDVMESLEMMHLQLASIEEAIEEGLMDQIEMDPAGGFDVDILQPEMDYGSALNANAMIANNLAMMAGAASLGVMQVESIEDLAEALEADVEAYEVGEMSEAEAIERVYVSSQILSQVIEAIEDPY